jgi:hypothetical protein
MKSCMHFSSHPSLVDCSNNIWNKNYVALQYLSRSIIFSFPVLQSKTGDKSLFSRLEVETLRSKTSVPSEHLYSPIILWLILKTVRRLQGKKLDRKEKTRINEYISAQRFF